MFGLSIDNGKGFSAFKAHEYVAHTSKVNCVAIGPRSGAVLATGGDDKRVNVWKIGRASAIWSLTGNSSGIEAVCFDPCEEYLFSGSSGGAVKLYDLTVGKMTRHFRGHMSNVTALHCGTFDRSFLATGAMDCIVKLWNTDTKECLMAFKGHGGEVTDVQFSPDGFLLASAAVDGDIKLWDMRAGKLLHTFQACGGPVYALAFNPQEFLLAAATSDRMVKLYDVEEMQFFCATIPEPTTVRSVTFDQDGTTLYAGSQSGLKAWTWNNDTATARLARGGDIAWDTPKALHYNPEGQVVAVSCSNSFVAIWAVDIEDQDASSGPPPTAVQLSGRNGHADITQTPSQSVTQSPRGVPAVAVTKYDEPKGRRNSIGGSAPSSRGPSPRNSSAKETPTTVPSNVTTSATNTNANISNNNNIRTSGVGQRRASIGGSINAVSIQGAPPYAVEKPANVYSERRENYGNMDWKEAKMSKEERAAKYTSVGTSIGDSLISQPHHVPAEAKVGPVSSINLPPSNFHSISVQDSGEEEDHALIDDKEWKRGERNSSSEASRHIEPTGPGDGGRLDARRGSMGERARAALDAAQAAAAVVAEVVSQRNAHMNNISNMRDNSNTPIVHSTDINTRNTRISNLSSVVHDTDIDTIDRPNSGEIKNTYISVSQRNAHMSSSPVVHSTDTHITNGVNNVDSNSYINKYISSDVNGGGIAQRDMGGPSSLSPPGGANRPRTATRRWDRPAVVSDDEIIAKTLMDRARLSSALASRLSHLRQVRELWSNGDAQGAVTCLQRIMPAGGEEQWTVACDFLGAINLESEAITLDTALSLLPMLLSIAESDGQERRVIVSFRSGEVLCRKFSGILRETRSATVLGVDLQFEKRLQKCTAIHGGFIRFQKALERVRREFYSDKDVQAQATRLASQLGMYFR